MKKLIFLGLFLLMFNFVFAAESVDQIVDKANKVAYYQGVDGRAKVVMTITDSQGRVRERAFKILRLDIDDGGRQKYYVYFLEPSDVVNMVYMVWKHLGKDDDRWMYLPALDLVKRIAASDKRSSFVGSDFVYEDISGRSLELDKHELISSDGKHYKIRNTPKNPVEAEFTYFDIYIDKNNYMPVKAEYYGPQGNIFRTVEALEVKDIQGYPTVTKSKVTNLESNSNTIIEFSRIEYDLGLDDSIFSERYLRRVPRQWLGLE